jgi:D-3-phosphoglycerate dehydrogenase
MSRIKPTLIYYDILQYQPENMTLLNEYFQVLTMGNPSQDRPDILNKAHVILAPLGFYLGKEKIDQSKNLKVIGSNTTGHPHIDVNYAVKKGIKVITLKQEHAFLDTITPTAELTWGLIIAISRNLIPAFQSVLGGAWQRWPFGGKSMLSRMCLGIVGMGRLGRMVASYGCCFNMETRYFDPHVPGPFSDIKRMDSLGSLVETSDIVTVHVPHEPETEGLFNREIFERFRDGAFFVNTSRGEVVEEGDLLDALKKGRLAGAAVDVLDGEFKPGFEKKVLNHPLVRYASERHNLIITPHIGGSTMDAWGETQEHTIRKIIEFFQPSE